MRSLLALFIRSLRQSTRAPSTYVYRMTIAVALLLFLWITSQISKWVGAPGLVFFGWIVGANYLAVSLMAMGSFASSISEEKEEGTMPLLQMTGLNPIGILFGKSGSRLLVALLMLAVQAPFTFVAVTMGGVSKLQILTAFTLIASYLFAIGNLAVFFSVWLSTATRAGLMTIATLVGSIVLVWAPTMTAEWMASMRALPRESELFQQLLAITNWAWSVHPMKHAYQLAAGMYLSIEVQRSVLVHLGIGVFFFALARLCFDRYCGNEIAYAAAGRKRWWQKFRRSGRPRRFPVAWKDFFFSFGGMRWVVARTVIYLLFVFSVSWSQPYKALGDAFAENALAVGAVMFYVELTGIALMLWGPEVWNRTLGSIVGLPRSLGRVTLEKLAAVTAAMTPVFVLLGCGVLLHPITYPLPAAFLSIGDALALGTTFAFFLSLVVFFSIRAKLIAIPLSLAIFGGFEFAMEFINSLQWKPRMQMSGDFCRLVVCLCHLVACSFVIWNTRRALLLRAADN